jgi:hypothetical protein
MANVREDQSVIASEALSATHWLQQKQRQNIAFQQIAAARAKSDVAAAIGAMVRREPMIF